MKIKPLGILYLNDSVVNHRSILKVLLNPILRIFGFCIATIYNPENDKLENIEIIEQKKEFNIFKNYKNSLFTCNKFNKIIRKRILI